MFACRGYGKILRRVGLDYHLTLPLSSPRSSRDLSHQLKSTFRGSVIGYVEAHVRRNNSHKTHIFKIQTFCNKLRAYQNIGFFFRKILEYPVDFLCAPRRVEIKTFHFFQIGRAHV